MASRTLTRPISKLPKSFSPYDDLEPVVREIDQKQLEMMPWIEKYRPSKLSDIVAHQKLISMLRVYIAKKSLPHLLFYGPPGTGKTSTIMACARELYGKYYPYMVMELNASDERGIKVVRHRITKFATSSNAFFGETAKDKANIFKLVILDETDAMTHDAQAMLRKAIEKHTPNVRFCLICNNIKKVIPPLQSRCANYRFFPLSSDEAKERLLEVADREGVPITEKAVELISRKSNGDMRRVLNTLQSVHMAYGEVDVPSVNLCLGYPDRKRFLEVATTMVERPYFESYQQVEKFRSDFGVSLEDFISETELLIRATLKGEKTPFSCYSTYDLATILDRLRVIELIVSGCTSETIQTHAVISIFKAV